jgi:exonuclease SbcC
MTTIVENKLDIMDAATSTGFDLLTVSMKGFNLYDDLNVAKFNNKFVTIFGPNGSGKSSVLDAITFALFGDTTRTDRNIMRMSDVCKPGGFTVIEFLKNGHYYRVKRGIKSNGDSYIELYIDGERFSGSSRTIDPEITRIIGMNYESFTASSIIRQEEMKLFSHKTPSQRLDTLQNLFHLDVFKEGLERAKKERSRIEKEIVASRGELGGMKSIVGNEQSIKDDIKERISAISSSKERIDTTTAEMLVAKADLDRLQKIREKIGALVARRDGVEASIADTRKRATSISSDIESIDATIETTPVPDIAVLESIRSTVAGRDALRSDLATAEGIVQTMNDQKQKYHDLIKKYSGGISIDEYTDIAKKVGAAESSTDPSIRKIVKKMQLDLDVKKTECIKGVVSSVLEKETMGPGTIPDIDGIREKIAAFDELAGNETGESIERKIADGKVTRERVAMLSKNISNRRSELVTVTGEIEANERELDRVITEIGGTNGIDGDIKKKESEISAIDARSRDLDRVISEARGSITILRGQLDKIAEYKKMTDGIEERLKKLDEELTMINVIVDEVLHSSGVAMYSIDLVISTIATRASELLGYMTMGRWSTITFMAITSGKSYGFEINVDGRKASSFSGGEKTMINAAIRFAIAEKLSEISSIGAQMKTLFLDEGDIGSLDSESSIQRFIETLAGLERYFSKIILISHVTGISEAFGGKTIRVELVNGHSKIVS